MRGKQFWLLPHNFPHKLLSSLLLSFCQWRVLFTFLDEVVLEEIGYERANQRFGYNAETITHSSYVSQGLPEAVAHTLSNLHVRVNVELVLKASQILSLLSIFRVLENFLSDNRILH